MIRALLVAAALASPAFAEGFTTEQAIRSQPLDLPAPASESLEFRGALVLSPPFAEFGGLSGLVVEAGGAATAVSDRGRWLRFRLIVEDGRLIGAEGAATATILYRHGRPLPGEAGDAEGLARDPRTGRYFVSFEGWHRIQPYDEPGGGSEPFFLAEEWSGFARNNGIEALAMDGDGALWAIAERGGAEALVWVGGREGWARKSLPLEGPYLPTGADFGPDGRLYVTERAFSLVSGFRFRLRRFVYGDGAEPESVETLLQYGAETRIDNIEAISIWREGDETLLLIASDDNFLPLQANVLALFAVR